MRQAKPPRCHAFSEASKSAEARSAARAIDYARINFLAGIIKPLARRHPTVAGMAWNLQNIGDRGRTCRRPRARCRAGRRGAGMNDELDTPTHDALIQMVEGALATPKAKSKIAQVVSSLLYEAQIRKRFNSDRAEELFQMAIERAIWSDMDLPVRQLHG